jgi:hypothetical protein
MSYPAASSGLRKMMKYGKAYDGDDPQMVDPEIRPPMLHFTDRGEECSEVYDRQGSQGCSELGISLLLS